MREKIDSFVQQCRQNDLVPAVVFGSSVNGLSYLRSLGRRKIPLLCVDHYRGTAARSRFGDFLLLPIKDGEAVRGERAADQLFSVLGEKGIKPVVFGSADEWQVYIARRSSAPKPPFISIAPGEKTMESIIDKQAQYELAKKLGITAPPFANAAAVMTKEVEWVDFPAIIKPRWAHLGRGAIGGKALFVDDAAALYENLKKLQDEAQVSDYIVQKVLAGSDSCLYSYMGFFEPSGQEFVGMVKRKLRQYPPFLGDGSFDVSCVDEPLAQAARKLLAEIDYHGLVGVEFKRDPDSENFGLIEINPRTISTNQLAIAAGIDFPWIAYQMAVHLHFPDKMPRPIESRQYKTNYHHVNEERDFKNYLIRKKNKETGFFEWLKSVATAQSYAFWAKNDPWPFFHMVLSKIVGRSS